MTNIDVKLDGWKKKLLDLGKRNRLINYRETKRSNLNIITPNYYELFKHIVVNEDTLVFPYPLDKQYEDDDDIGELRTDIIKGDLETDRTIKEQQRTLKALREKAKTAMEEQGVNILYLSFGFLRWRESASSSDSIVSPIVLVPVTITIESITEPYKLSLHEDEIVVNPTLAHKMDNDFAIKLPDFDDQNEDIVTYLKDVAQLISKSGWTVENRVSLSLLSFLKINMYYDLNIRAAAIKNHAIVKALCGDNSEVMQVPEEMNNYDHDKNDRPVDIYQVVDADSSQQDAVALSKKGISFVLQGPPGTGKSQTITNIISEALADGKKVLFVSEKMAALEVVHRRLTSVGLADFCLILHSHKANKRVILKSLGDTLNLDRVSVREEALYQLEVLKYERDKLNTYSVQLHTPVHPLGRTIFEVNGFLAKLNPVPDLIFSIENVEQTNAHQLRAYTYLLTEFTKTIEKMQEDYVSNPWKGCNVEQVSHELRQNINVCLTKLLPQVGNIAIYISQAFEDLSLDNNMNYNNMNDYAELLDFCAEPPQIPSSWLSNSEFVDLMSLAKSFDKMKKEHSSIVAELSAAYTDEVYTIDGHNVSTALNEYFKQIFDYLDNNVYKSEKEIYDSIEDLLTFCDHLKMDCKNLLSLSGDISKELQLTAPSTIEEITKLYDFMTFFVQNILPTEGWFTIEDNNERLNMFNQARETQDEINSIKSEVLSVYEEDVLNLDYVEILKRFKTEYTSIFKILKKSYRKDCKDIRMLRIIPVKKVQDSEILNLLNNLKLLHKKTNWIREQDSVLKDKLGGFFIGEDTNYENIENAFAAFEKVIQYFYGFVPGNIKQLLLSGKNYMLCSGTVTDIQSILHSGRINSYAVILSEKNIITKNLTHLLHEIDNIATLLNSCNLELNKFVTISNEQKDYDFHKNNLSHLVRLQRIQQLIEAQTDVLKQKYQFLYKGMDTDWEKILSSLLWTSKFKDYIKRFNLSVDFQDKIITGEFIEKVTAYAYFIKESREQISVNIDWFSALYDAENDIKRLNFFALQDKIEKCLHNLVGLEEWIDFRTARENCEAEGLSDFINLVLEQKIDKRIILDTFKKRFYKLWLDAILPDYDFVYAFRGRNQEDTIKRFTELDKAQMEIARLRIRERLIASLPDVNRITSALDEVGILKRELAKQRKIMPIRKLFTRIPTLLPCLKPCLMMSPLSVSLFLQSDSYNLDMVIFDEASQVCTENAVGAIIRAKQIIIAGDSKQLPPTNFFNASISDGDFDVDDEDVDDSFAYESVLDEAVTVLPERSLKWHYRSRHEDLITFSNAKIYNNSLVTFPSHIDRVIGYGVEYIFVEDGVYDRSGKRNNINEAKKVAALVFEHLSNHPKRSLGVVTFSEAQQQAVDSAIRQLRIQNPQCEDFFNDDKEEPFFIKNLENVQGDERDTIIFSIGYAKDSKGVMYMNFGPLSRDGGYRRLNVAITRAKFNIKLVGSIHPTDIRLENINSEGVKMLRTYIEFAINGTSVLENELTYDKFVNVDSPFEEAVYDFLVSKGFRVTTQIGCSGYRIDMAVKHPTLDGRFVLGIECDGATYHSSRTARERDRLRQDVLEAIGWTIYRIWSTDWIKDPKTEGTKLVDAVNKAIAQYCEGSSCTLPLQNENLLAEVSADKYLVIEDPVANDGNNEFGFEVYQEADVYSVPRYDNGLTDLCNIIEHVVKTEYPIHVDLLCKRLAPVFGNQKTTNRIRGQAEYGLSQMKNRVSQKGDFLYPISYESVVPRIPAEGKAPRLVSNISPDELGCAMQKIISQGYGITKESLFQITAREYGYKRTTGNIVTAFEKAFDILLNDKKIQVIEERLSVAK